MQWLIPGTDSMIAYVVIFAATVLEFILLPAPGGPLPPNLGGFGSGSWGRSLVFTSPLQGRLCVTRILQIDARLKVLRRDYRAVLPSLWNSDTGLFDVLSGCEPFRSAPRQPLRLSLQELLLFGSPRWLPRGRGAGRVQEGSRSPHPCAFTPHKDWFFTIDPVDIFSLARLIKRTARGPVEEVFQPRAKPRLRRAIPLGRKESTL